jgi:RNA polymerase sigma-70 factor (ECF subfamily)
MTGNEQDAEDVVQETFIKAHGSMDRFELRADFGSWLHRIAANCALDLLRARKRRQGRQLALTDGEGENILESLPDGGPEPESLAFHGEIRRDVGQALRRLTGNERAAFVLRHYEERSIAEISLALGITDNAVKQCIFRAVRKLRHALSRPATRDGARSTT